MKQQSELYNNIIQAAISLFNRNGFESTSMMDIVKEAGASKGAIYHYFTSKEELIDTVFRICHEANEIAAMEGVDQQQYAIDKLCLRAKNLVCFSMNHPEIAHVNGMYTTQPRFISEYNYGYHQFSHYQSALKLVTQGIEAGELKALPADFLAEIYYNMCAGIFSYAHTNPASIEDKDFWKEVRQMMMDALAVKP